MDSVAWLTVFLWAISELLGSKVGGIPYLMVSIADIVWCDDLKICV